MTERDPAARPTAIEALQHWKKIRSKLWAVQRSWLVAFPTDSVVETTISHILSFFHMFPWFSRRLKIRIRKLLGLSVVGSKS